MYGKVHGNSVEDLGVVARKYLSISEKLMLEGGKIPHTEKYILVDLIDSLKRKYLLNDPLILRGIDNASSLKGNNAIEFYAAYKNITPKRLIQLIPQVVDIPEVELTQISMLLSIAFSEELIRVFARHGIEVIDK
jgi:hypothetical protein